MAPGGDIFPPIVVVAVLVLLTAALHPARRDLVRVGDVNGVLAGLTALGAIPLLVYAFNQWTLQTTVVDEHSTLGHYTAASVYALLVIVIALVASGSTGGKRFAAVMAGGMAVVLGLASVLYPALPSAASTLPAVALLVWGIAFVVGAELTARGYP